MQDAWACFDGFMQYYDIAVADTLEIPLWQPIALSHYFILMILNWKQSSRLHIYMIMYWDFTTFSDW